MNLNLSSPRKILFATSEIEPFVSVGALADFAGNLPLALSLAGQDIRVILPAYPQAVAKAIPLEPIAKLQLPGIAEPVRILQGRLTDEIPLYLVDAPGLFGRPGHPYKNAGGNDWQDNGQRFALFCRAVSLVALDQAGINWQPDLVHCNDWQTGLVPALLSSDWNRPATLFTLHNPEQQGTFDQNTCDQSSLPKELCSPAGLGINGRISFLKGGTAFADWLTTISPTRAEEISTASSIVECEQILTSRHERLTGILNGVDSISWDPASTDTIPQAFDATTFELKAINKQNLQQSFGLEQSNQPLLLGYIRQQLLNEDVDLILDILPDLANEQTVQLVIAGTVTPELEQRLLAAKEQYQDILAVDFNHNLPMSQTVLAGCDALLFPSDSGNGSYYAMRGLKFGAIPIAHNSGTLADIVVPATPRNQLHGTATGFLFDTRERKPLLATILQAVDFYKKPGVWWKKLAISGMKQEFSWHLSAKQYSECYLKAIDNPVPNPLAKL